MHEGIGGAIQKFYTFQLNICRLIFR